MPIASAKARPRIMLVWIAGRASGLRPSASIAFATRLPMPSAGPIAPMPMAIPAPMFFMPSSEMCVVSSRIAIIAVSRCIFPPPGPAAPRPRHRGIVLAWSGPTRAAHTVARCASRRGHSVRRRLRRLPVCSMRLVLALVVRLNGHHGENEGEQRKDCRLNEAHERLQSVEDDGKDERGQERDESDQHVAGEDVAEETE